VAAGVAMWWCDLARSRAEIDALNASLAHDEHVRAARFGRPDLRDRYVVGRAMLRLVLSRELDMKPDAVPICHGARGRPFVEGSAGLDFNVSHTDGKALIGIAHGRRIGVDLESDTRIANAERLARRVLTAEERRALEGVAGDDHRRAFLRHWTCKEALSKATGDGLSAPFGRISVTIAPILRLTAGPEPYRPDAWELVAVAVPTGYLGTVALSFQR
jgi:4'-phosphopantetheinyl transferase